MEHVYRDRWEEIEKSKDKPCTYKKLLSIDYNEFKNKIFKKDKVFVNEVIESIYNGDLYILKNAIDKTNVKNIIDGSTEFFKKNPSTFHKMLENTPNFNRWIDKESGRKYSISLAKHSLYLFNWNKDICKIREIITKACEPLKYLSGLEADEFSLNTPQDHIVERVQVVRYPPRGYIEPHYDNNKIIRLIISGYLSKRGKSYKKGGFYVIDENRKLDMEDHIEEGDIGFFYASLKHGMETIDPDKKPIKNKKNGRWWFGFNIHNSDVVKNRYVATPVNLKNKP